MAARFSFWAYGILAIAAFAIFLYTTTTAAGRPDIGGPLLNIATFIVVTFVLYMFVKLFLRRH